jgi:dolichol-phosphate mannosyltransferase
MTPLLTVIIPVFNECKTIDEILSRVVAAIPSDKEILVVDDGSTDGSSKRLDEWENVEHVSVFRHERNQGKGMAVRTALAHAKGKFVIIQDADLEYDPNDYAALLRPLQEEKADVVYGSRALARKRCNIKDRGLLNPYRLGVAVLNISVRLLFGLRVTDEATCYKVFSTSILRAMELQCKGFEFCPEVTAKTARMKLKLQEVPIRYAPRSKRDGKKIGLSDAFKAWATLWKWRRWSPGEEFTALSTTSTLEPCLKMKCKLNDNDA